MNAEPSGTPRDAARRVAVHDQAWVTAVVADLQRWACAEGRHEVTSQVTGGGAVRVAEGRLSVLVGGRPTVLVASATLGLRAALGAVGVRRGDDVLIPRVDWPATRDAVASLGARSVLVDVDPATLTIDPACAARARTPAAAAVVACHSHGIPADVPALRAVLPGLPVVEDAAAAFGSALDGVATGMLGDAAVFSFGPGKAIEVGECGAVVVRDDALRVAVLRRTAHPVRLLLETGLAGPAPDDALPVRPHPIAAVLLAVALPDWTPAQEEHDRLAAALSRAGRNVLGADGRRTVATRAVAVRGPRRWGDGFDWSPSPLVDLADETPVPDVWLVTRRDVGRPFLPGSRKGKEGS